MERISVVVNEIVRPCERTAPPIECVKPPRLNFARRCIYCLERDCDSPRCEALYARSRWAVCPECDGREGDGISGEQCTWCTFGVIEIAPRVDGPAGQR